MIPETETLESNLEHRVNWLQRCTDVYTIKGLLALERDLYEGEE